MRKRMPPAATMLGLAAASWETILHRSVMMANGTCSPAEYGRMVTEKVAAGQKAALAMMTGASPAAIMAPYVKAARANARRLRSRK